MMDAWDLSRRRQAAAAAAAAEHTCLAHAIKTTNLHNHHHSHLSTRQPLSHSQHLPCKPLPPPPPPAPPLPSSSLPPLAAKPWSIDRNKNFNNINRVNSVVASSNSSIGSASCARSSICTSESPISCTINPMLKSDRVYFNPTCSQQVVVAPSAVAAASSDPMAAKPINLAAQSLLLSSPTPSLTSNSSLSSSSSSSFTSSTSPSASDSSLCADSAINATLSAGVGGDRRARKKDQNRRAAYNYRRKKMAERNKLVEEEMRLVFARVCLTGYADELEQRIMMLLESKVKCVLGSAGQPKHFLCPLCIQSCDNLPDLRSHINVTHPM